MAQPDLVLQDAGHADKSHPVPASTPSTIPAMGSTTVTPHGNTCQALFCNTLWQRFQNSNFSTAATELATSTYNKASQSAEGTKIAKWFDFCLAREVDPHKPSIEILANYIITLHEQFLRGNSVHQYLRALSHIICKECRPMLKDPDIALMIKACRRLKPQVPKLPLNSWNPDDVLDFISALPSNLHLSEYHLSQKAFLLALLASGHRKGDLVYMSTDPDYIKQTDTEFTFILPFPTKGFHPGSNHSFMQKVIIKKYPFDHNICPYRALQAYIDRCRNRSLCYGFWVTTTPAWGPASPDTLQRWAKVLLSDTGVDMTIFTPHSTRAAAANRALQQGEPIDLVMQHCAWASTSTFHKYYYHPAAGPVPFRPDREIFFRPSRPSTMGKPGSLPPGVSCHSNTSQLLPVSKPCAVTIVIPTSSTAPASSADTSPPVTGTHMVTPPSPENLQQPTTTSHQQ